MWYIILKTAEAKEKGKKGKKKKNLNAVQGKKDIVNVRDQ